MKLNIDFQRLKVFVHQKGHAELQDRRQTLVHHVTLPHKINAIHKRITCSAPLFYLLELTAYSLL